MAATTTSDATPPSTRRDFLVALLSLVAVLAVLYHRSFRPDEIVFSNDSPLGAVAAQADHAWDNLRGVWQDLNWLGGRQPGGFLSVGNMIYAILGPLPYSKFMPALSLLYLGLCAWFLFRRLGLHPVACVLGGLAAALNMNAVSISSWGVPSWTLARGSIYLALAALASVGRGHTWARTALAGLAVGLGLMDGLDVGAFYSIYIAAYVLFEALVSQEPAARRAGWGFVRVALVAVCAALISANALTVLIGTQIKGVVGMEQDVRTKQMRWEQATQWSVPKVEALRIIIPGLFGYRMPELYHEPVQSVEGSNYWGSVGQGPGQYRHSGEGEFAGVLVSLVACWSLVQLLRRKNNPFTDSERKFIWFWGGAALVSLLLAFGKYTPVYQLVYALPYFSTIRNPFKFLHPFHLAWVILFAYGLHGLCRRYLSGPESAAKSPIAQVKNWWKTAPPFDRNWALGCIAALAITMLGWLVFASSKNELVRYLEHAGFPAEQYPQLAAAIARFSLQEVGLFILFLALSVALLVLLASGAFAGRRARWAGIALGLLLVVDFARADHRWIVYWNYKEKYATNPVIDFLREKPVESRVTAELAPFTREYLVNEQGGTFSGLYFEWLSHHFQYYHIPSLDIIQMPRIPEFDQTYMLAFRPNTNQATLAWCGRLWQLTSTRYVFGMTGFLNFLNNKVDPGKQRIRVQTPFKLGPKPGVTTVTTLEQLTAVPVPDGAFALFEFTGALPRARLFAQWQVSTNDQATLERLRSPDFDPEQTVLVANDLPAPASAGSTNQVAGTVQITHYEPKDIQLDATAAAPSVLLFNDHFDPDWNVLVDGKPEALLRCNYIMRGVFLAPGRHTVQFRFQPPATTFYISLASWVTGLALLGFLAVSDRPRPLPASQPAPKSAAAAKR